MAKISRIPKFGLAIDWETSGYSLPDYAKCHQGISFGAIIFDVRTFDQVEFLYREIKFDKKYEWSTGAEKVHGLTQEYLEKNGVTQEEAATDLCNMIIKYIGTEDILLLGHRVGFDKAFTQQLTGSVGINLSYNPVVLDTCSFGTAFMELSYSDELFDAFGFPERTAHNSLEDITLTLQTLKLMKEAFLAGLLSQMT